MWSRCTDGRNYELITILSVLESLSFSILSEYQPRMSSIKISIFKAIWLMSDASKVVYDWQSSAYIWNCIPCLLIMSPKGSMLIVNRIGQSTHLWGTPHTNDVGFDWVPLISTDCDLPDKYDLTQFKAVPQIPSPDLSLSRSTSWSTVSKAALKSSMISNTLLLSSMALNMASCTHVNVVSVLWNEDCNSSYKLLLVIRLCSREAMTFSIGFEI